MTELTQDDIYYTKERKNVQLCLFMALSGPHYYSHPGAAGSHLPRPCAHHRQPSDRVPVRDPLHPQWSSDLSSLHPLQTAPRSPGQTHGLPPALPGGGAS